MASNIILIPIYKQTMTVWENKSFRQCLKVLGKHKIGIFTFEDLDTNRYSQIAKEFNICIDYYYFNKTYFSSVKGYNKLMLTKDFYKRFHEYQYMLIYQLDAWVFRDELDYWCDQGYDYIGAPVYNYLGNGKYATENPFVGNGGFSLRKIPYCMKVLSYPSFLPFIKPLNYIKTYREKIKWYAILPNALGRRNNIRDFINRYNEDIIFSHFTSESFMKIKMPDIKTAIRFAFEMYPSKLYQINNFELPFGCHAFEKYEFELFWHKHIV